MTESSKWLGKTGLLSRPFENSLLFNRGKSSSSCGPHFPLRRLSVGENGRLAARPSILRNEDMAWGVFAAPANGVSRILKRGGFVDDTWVNKRTPVCNCFFFVFKSIEKIKKKSRDGFWAAATHSENLNAVVDQHSHRPL